MAEVETARAEQHWEVREGGAQIKDTDNRLTSRLDGETEAKKGRGWSRTVGVTGSQELKLECLDPPSVLHCMR